MRAVVVTVPYITASIWNVGPGPLRGGADISEVLEEHGPGVYTVGGGGGGAKLDRHYEVISMYSIFHEVDIPEEYN